MTTLAAFILFAAVTLITPGPNNAMLMSSGLTWGWRRALPHLVGVTLGFGLMVAVVGLGLGALFDRNPVLYAILKYAGAAYMLWLAWKIATAEPHGPDETTGSRPITFIEAALFQWVNPKAWVMAIGTVSTYAAVAPFPWNIAIFAGVFTAGGFLSSAAWVGLGTSLKRIINNPQAVRVVNILLGLGLVLSVAPVVVEDFLGR